MREYIELQEVPTVDQSLVLVGKGMSWMDVAIAVNTSIGKAWSCSKAEHVGLASIGIQLRQKSLGGWQRE